VFTEGEIAYCRAKRDFASSFAARFAAKEAAMKALGPATRAACSGPASKWFVAAAPHCCDFTTVPRLGWRRSAPHGALVTLTHSLSSLSRT
jgi:phosphopantetheinyl transferase (holo-ACP synthase)